MVARRIFFHILGAVIGALVALAVLRLLHVTGTELRTGITAGGLVMGLALGRAASRATSPGRA